MAPSFSKSFIHANLIIFFLVAADLKIYHLDDQLTIDLSHLQTCLYFLPMDLRGTIRYKKLSSINPPIKLPTPVETLLNVKVILN